MQDTDFYKQLLGLSRPWQVDGVEMDLAAGEVRVQVSCQATAWAGEDGQRLHIHGYEQRRWRHLDTCQLRTVIDARVPRVLDPETRKTVMVNVPWASPRSGWTLMFEHFAIRVIQACATTTDAMKLTGLNWGQIQKIMNAAVKRGLEKRKIEKIEYIGLDEKSFKRGQDYISVMTDLSGGRVLEIEPGRDTETVVRLWEKLPGDTRAGVLAAAMDFGAPYAAGTRQAVPAVLIVHDKFHVSQLLNEAVDEVRRQEHKSLKAKEEDTLKNTRGLWLKGLENLSAKQLIHFESLVELSLKTAEAWEHKELFRGFWQEREEMAAREFFELWEERAEQSGLGPVKRTAKTLRKHLRGLLNYFEHSITNSLTEGLNSCIQLMKAAARGFRNFQHYRTRILFVLGKLDLLPPLSQPHGI